MFELSSLPAFYMEAHPQPGRTVGSAAANYCIDPETKSALGLDININHIRAVRPGMITAIAVPLHLGKMTHVWEIKIFNELKQLVSAARLTMAIINKNPGQSDRGGSNRKD